jgi:hypothetical protein
MIFDKIKAGNFIKDLYKKKNYQKHLKSNFLFSFVGLLLTFYQVDSDLPGYQHTKLLNYIIMLILMGFFFNFITHLTQNLMTV